MKFSSNTWQLITNRFSKKKIIELNDRSKRLHWDTIWAVSSLPHSAFWKTLPDIAPRCRYAIQITRGMLCYHSMLRRKRKTERGGGKNYLEGYGNQALFHCHLYLCDLVLHTCQLWQPRRIHHAAQIQIESSPVKGIVYDSVLKMELQFRNVT